ncbi:MAG: phosphate ABC transporter permease PstA [Planctomycetota bacterium]
MSDAKLRRRHRLEILFKYFCASMTWLSILLLAVLIFHIVKEGVHYLRWDFLTSFPSRRPEIAGIKSALWGTVWLIVITASVSVFIGIAAAIYLEEYAPQNRVSRFIEINIVNLAGVPSIVYGMLGLVVFVRFMALGRSVLAGGLTMSLLTLPVIIVSAREAIRAVPVSIRKASYALGATRWQTVRHHVLPLALPGIITGVILAMARAIGETAPLIMIGALSYVAFVPQSPMDSFMVLPIQIFTWISKPQKEFHDLAATAIIVLLAVLLIMNGAAVYLRFKTEKKRIG